MFRKKVARASQEQVLVPVTIRDNEPPSVVSMMENAVERFRDNSMLETVVCYISLDPKAPNKVQERKF